MASMTRRDLAEAVRNKTDMTTPQASEVVEALLEAMLHRLEQGDEVKLPSGSTALN